MRADTGGLPSRVAVLITASAVTIAAVRLAWPDLRLDSVTLGLLIVALIPWLAPVVRSLKAFGVEVDFQEFRQEVTERLDDVESTVQRLAPLAVTGGTPQQKAFLEELLGRFNEYAQSLGVEASAPPSVSIEPDINNAYYDLQKEAIVVDTDLAGDPDVVLREYSHHVLFGLRPDQVNEVAAVGVEHGLADYLVCSFKDSPVLAERAALVFRQTWGLDRPYVRNLKNDTPFGDLEEPHAVGEVWGGAFWKIRGRLGKPKTERLLVDAWSRTKDFGEKPVSPAFAATLRQVVAESAPEQAETVDQELARRGVG